MLFEYPQWAKYKSKGFFEPRRFYQKLWAIKVLEYDIWMSITLNVNDFVTKNMFILCFP